MIVAIDAERSAKTKFRSLNLRARIAKAEKFFLKKVRVSERDV
jgi:hypothetical protein